MDAQLTQFADEVTAGLQDDPELRLDVRAEVLTHLEEAADGTGTAEALKAFGPATDVAQQLTLANLRRMRARGLAKLLFRVVLAPAAVLAALVLGYGGLMRLTDLIGGLNLLASSEAPPMRLPRPAFVQTWQARHDATQRNPVLAANHDAAACYAHWTQRRDAPEGNALYAHYTLLMISQGRASTPEQVDELLRQGMRLDSDNALYDYLLADYHFSKAVSYSQGKLLYEDVRLHRKVFQHDYVLKDRTELEAGIRAFQAGLAKPAVRSYHPELHRLLLESLPEPRYTEDYLRQIMVSAGILFPEFAKYRGVARNVPYAGYVLMREGRTAEGEALLAAWKPLTRQLLRDNDRTLIGALVIGAVAATGGEASAQQYIALGHPDRAKVIRGEVQHRLRYFNAWRDGKTDYAKERRYFEHAGILASLLLPVFRGGGPAMDVAELAPTRYLEQTLFEQFAAAMVLLLLSFGMVTVGVAAFIYQLAGKSPEARPLLVLPRWGDVARILGFGLLLPLAVYAVITRTGLDGRNFGFGPASQLSWRALLFFGELVVMVLVLVFLPIILAKRALARRCQALGLLEGQHLRPRTWLLVVKILGVCLAGLALFVPIAISADAWRDQLSEDIVLVILLLSSSTLLVLGSLSIISLVRRHYGTAVPTPIPRRYPGTLARSMTLIYALLIMVLSITLTPTLLLTERIWLSRDRLLTPFSDGGFTSIETRVAQYLRGELLKGFAE